MRKRKEVKKRRNRERRTSSEKRQKATDKRSEILYAREIELGARLRARTIDASTNGSTGREGASELASNQMRKLRQSDLRRGTREQLEVRVLRVKSSLLRWPEVRVAGKEWRTGEISNERAVSSGGFEFPKSNFRGESREVDCGVWRARIKGILVAEVLN